MFNKGGKISVFENCKMLRKKLNMTQINGKILHPHRLEELILLKSSYYSKQSTGSIKCLSKPTENFHTNIRNNKKNMCVYVYMCSVMSDSLQPHGLWPSRLLSPWDSPGKNPWVGCHFLLQGSFKTQGLNLYLLHLLHWQEDSLSLCHLGNPLKCVWNQKSTNHKNNPEKEEQSWWLAAKSLQSCPTLCDLIDGSPPGSAVPGILQARTPEWVAISFSNAWKWKVKVNLLSRVQLLATPWTAAYQAPPSMGFSKQEYWSGVPWPSPKLVA